MKFVKITFLDRKYNKKNKHKGDSLVYAYHEN